MTCCFLLVSEKVFPGKSSLFPEMHHVWENVLDGALMVGDEATFGLQQHVNSSVSTGKSIASFIFVPTEAAHRWGWVFFFSLSDCWTSVKRGFYGVSHYLSLTPSSLSFLCQWHQPLCERSLTCHKVFQGPGVTLTNDKGRVQITFFSVT